MITLTQPSEDEEFNDYWLQEDQESKNMKSKDDEWLDHPSLTVEQRNFE